MPDAHDQHVVFSFEPIHALVQPVEMAVEVVAKLGNDAADKPFHVRKGDVTVELSQSSEGQGCVRHAAILHGSTAASMSTFTARDRP
jgi:hypothetical protein